MIGRVIAVEDDCLYLQSEWTTQKILYSSKSPPLGALVEVAYSLAEPGIVARTLTILHSPRGQFPETDSDWWWFTQHNNRRASNLIMRSKMFSLLRGYFERNEFLEVDTPQRVLAPGSESHLDPVESENHWLVTSPELQMKRLLSAGFDKIFQICHCFRGDEEGQRHQPEFSMLEWYRAYAGIDDILRDTENFVSEVVRTLTDSEKISWQGNHCDVSRPWARLSVKEAFSKYATIPYERCVKDSGLFFREMVESIEPNLGFEQPVFLTDYPAQFAALARLKPGDPSVAERAELFIAGIELCNAYGELTSPEEQRSRISSDQNERISLGKDKLPVDQRFLRALAEGMPPSGGNALGLDRLLMLLTDSSHIQDVVTFPHSRL